MTRPHNVDRCHRRHVRNVILATVLLLGLLAMIGAGAAETSVFMAADPFHGDGEIGAFLEHRRARFQIHAGCFNPCAVGIEYLWHFKPENFELFLGLAALDGVNHVNGTKINFSFGLSTRLTKRISFQARHYSNGARWHSPISDDEAPNRGWNF
ncbi:MAG: hypothetical protein NUV63_03000, partial [Gallionella sp.]|nr:hypothetical protein [Gallionella sp.]